MAINGVVFNSKNVKLGYAAETTFGTAIADAAAFTQLVEFDSVTIDYGLAQDFTKKNRGTTSPHPFDDDIYSSHTGGLRVITISGLILRKDDAPYFLYGVFQNVTEGAETPFQKTFTFSSTQPVFSSNAGMFMTIALDKHIASYDEKYTSCIVRSITLTADLVSGDGRLRADVELISGFAPSTTANISGTWTAKAQEYLDFNAMTLAQIDDADVVVYDFSVTMNNNAQRIGYNTSGVCQSYVINQPEAIMEGSITVKYDANTQGELAAYIAGTPTKIEWGINDGDADGDFYVGGEGVYTGYSEPNNETGATMTLPFKMIYDTDSPANPGIIMSDANDLSWPNTE